MNKNLKLYVWEDVLTDYTDGIMFAVASSVEEARKIILEKQDYSSVKEDLMKEPKIINDKCAFLVWGGG